MIEKLLVCGKEIHFCSFGLDDAEREDVRDIALQTIRGAKHRDSIALERCTFFADPGYDALVKSLTGRSSSIDNPRVEGDDRNPFDQHYWVAFDVVRKEDVRPVVIDPILRYVGLQEEAYRVIPGDNLRFYARKRIVVPHAAVWDGGVRVKTMGL